MVGINSGRVPRGKTCPFGHNIGPYKADIVIKRPVEPWIQAPIVALIEDELTAAGFPFDDVTPLKKKDMTDLKNYMILLDQIDLPEHLTGENDPPLPIKILLSPITKRFHYHFYSTSSKESFHFHVYIYYMSYY